MSRHHGKRKQTQQLINSNVGNALNKLKFHITLLADFLDNFNPPPPQKKTIIAPYKKYNAFKQRSTQPLHNYLELLLHLGQLLLEDLLLPLLGIGDGVLLGRLEKV